MRFRLLQNTAIAFFALPLLIWISSCERDAFKPGEYGRCNFSTDTVMFDTIFSGQGTATYRLLVRNPNDFKVEFDSIYLARRNSSGFILNIDGDPSSLVRRISLDAKDSLYIFIQAFIPPSGVNDPFINEDSIVFKSGQYVSDVKLIAVAQNVISFRNINIQTQEWNNSKPYLIFGTLTVDPAASLTIQEGAKIYFHKNARLQINGTLAVNGTHQAPVVFRSDRLEKDYDTIPGQWGGIELLGVENKHVLNYAIIRNGTTGIRIGNYTDSNVVKAEISNTRIINMGYSALLAYQTDVTVKNCVLANCRNNVCSILYGGNYEFVHCTLANYGARYVASDVGSKALVVQNFVAFLNENEQYEYLSRELNASFSNSVIYGVNADEIGLVKKEEHPFNYKFENCLLRISGANKPETDPNIVQCVLNKSPLFLNPDKENFRLDTLSAAKDVGKPEIGATVPLDLDNNSRISDIAPDMGAYERIEKQ